VFTSQRDIGDAVYVIMLSTGQARHVTAGSGATWLSRNRILFDGRYDTLFTVRPYGAHVQILEVSVPSYSIAPNVSRDGKKIVFAVRSDEDWNSYNLYTANADGTGVRVLSTAGDAGEPVWSPDGLWVAYDFWRNLASSEIYLVRSDGSGITRLTNAGDACCADWRAGTLK